MQVRRQHPRDGGLARVQRLPDLGQRRHHHRLQQDVGERREREHAERERRVLAIVGLGVRHAWSSSGGHGHTGTP